MELKQGTGTAHVGLVPGGWQNNSMDNTHILQLWAQNLEPLISV